MGRRWIMVELGDHCHTHIIPRLEKIINGEDQGGISEVVGWQGGGGFRYYSLAPSLIEFDKYNQPVINKEYNPVMLTQAMCKLMGFTYAPSDTVYWQQGHSTETDFIYVTTQTLEQAQLAALSEEVGEGRTLLICCSAFRGKADQFENLTVRKIPRAVLDKCDWSKDDYSLNVQNLPMLEQDNEPRTALKPAGSPRSAKAKKAASAAATGSLFGGDDADE
jgi:adenine-specific DNA-methyltransferase